MNASSWRPSFRSGLLPRTGYFAKLVLKMERIESLDYGYFINQHSARRKPALTRELTKKMYNAPKDSISLAEGMPNEVTFPFEEISIKMKDGSRFSLEGAELNAALQYLPTQGYPPLLKTLKEFTKQIHDPPKWTERDLIVTSGSQDGISKTLEMMVQEGDTVLVQNPFYTGTEIILKPYKVNLLGVPQDQFGIIPQKLVNILETCKAEPGGRMPKVMYLNPTVSNPAGNTMPLERRKEVYQICCQYNIIILEDDAYYFLEFSDERPVSFLSLDTELRVMRFDSFSKVLSSGLRMGFLTGPKQLVQRVELHIQSSFLHANSLSQVLLEKLLQHWGFEGLLSHFQSVKTYYRVRRDCTLASMDRHLKGLCDWTIPSGGMFVWIKVRGVSDVYEMLMTRGLKKNITFVPGHAFMADPTQACNYIRASYSKATPKQIDKAFRLLAELIREEQVLLRRKLENCT